MNSVVFIAFCHALQVLVIFMVSEAGGLIPLCCLCLYVLLTLVQRARLKLFNVFLVSAVKWSPGVPDKLGCSVDVQLCS